MSPSLIISIIAVGISAIAIGVSIWTHNRNHKLQARIVALEEARETDRLTEKKKAILTAHIVSGSYPNIAGGQTPEYKLRIENKGLGEARDVKVILDDKPILEHPAIPQGTSEVTKVGPNSPIQYLLSLSMQTTPPFILEITWEDDSGEPGEYSTTLTL